MVFVVILKILKAIGSTIEINYPAPEYTANFVENHDNKRFLNRCPDRGYFTNAVVFGLLWEGIPVFYYGGEQYYAGGLIAFYIKLYQKLIL